MYHLHTYCRACGYAKPTGPGGIKSAPSEERLKLVLDLGVQPLANDFRKPGEEHSGYVPLQVLLCPRCSLAQLSVVVDPHVLYDRYSYVTSPSQTMLDHFAWLTKDLLSMKPNPVNVLEIGSNDGTLLEFLKKEGLGVEGIDPAENLCAIAAEKGIQTTQALFDTKTAASLPKSDLIIARHVFCHVHDWQDFVKALDMVSLPDSLIAIETPYVLDLISQNQFDTIYHEHLSYLNLRAVEALLKDTPLKLVDVIHYPIHGGAILLLLSRLDSSRIPTERFISEVEKETELESFWNDFRRRQIEMVAKLATVIRDYVQWGKTVAALGASAKSTVWISACGFTRNEIKFIADTTKQKWGTTSPGTDIPIVDEGAILRELPDYIIVFAWNYKREILEKNQLAISKGVKFIFPIPELEIVGSTDAKSD